MAMGLNLPSGVLTFLFTDIQGSTPLWEKDPAGMRQALDLHNTSLQRAIEAHGGQVFKIVGDEFQAVFVEPVQAVNAAVAAQRVLAGAAWGRVGPLRVRMGIHTGQAQAQGSDYAVAHTFNRAARIMSAGHGGQILLSLETAVLVRGQLAPDVTLRDMGRHSLKGLRQQEHLFQLVAPGLAADFPPLQTRDVQRHNLPAQVTPFIGRESEIAEIEELIAPRRAGARDVRLLTLTGSGGTGKTRLALQVAERMLPEFADGVFFVDLAAISDAAFVLPAVERALAIRENRDQSSAERLGAYLGDKRLLLLLDNFEQVLPAANAVAGLLPAASGLKLLVTSRSLLRIYGEVGYEVMSLRCPDPRQLPGPEGLIRFESIQLFSEHARAVKSSFAIDEGNGRTVAQICRRLDGLPLAIELAAARIRMLAPQQILVQLENCFQILSGGARNLPPRQRTLQGAIDWSYDLLDEQEQALFRRMGIFARGCSFAGAAAVCDFDGEIDIFGGLEALIDHSLVSQSARDDEPRFVMLQTIRDYALKKLESHDELAKARRRHLAFYAQFAAEAQPFVESAEQNLWLDRLEQDYDNLSAALRFAIDDVDVAQAARIAQALRIFWFSRGYLLEGRQLLADLLALPMEAAQRAPLLDSAGFLARYHGDYAAAEAYIGEGLAIARRLGDQHAVADSLANAGFVYLHQNDFDRAREVYSEALAIYHELDNEQGTADASIHLGLVAFYESDQIAARRYYAESLAIWQRLGDKQGTSYAQHMLGDSAFQEGEYDTAENLYRLSLGDAAEIGFHLVIAAALEGLACIAVVQDRPQRALKLAAVAAETRKNANFPSSAARGQLIERALAPAREMLSTEAAEAAWQSGLGLALDEVVDEALAA